MQTGGPLHKSSPPEENSPLGRPILRWQDITKVGLSRNWFGYCGLTLSDLQLGSLVGCYERVMRLPVP
jgi:hypothetical protein